MEPKKPQLDPESSDKRKIADSITMGFAKPKQTKLTDLKVDSVTGNYRGTKPVDMGKEVDTKVEISKIRSDKARDAEASAETKKLIQENSDEITKMRARKPSKKVINYYKNKLAAQKAASEQ